MTLAPELRSVDRTKVIFEGRKHLFFGGNDYHRLSSHPEVVQAACAAAAEHGLNVAGSRITTGNHPLYGELEGRLARFLGAEGVAVSSSGYLSNTIILEAVAADFHRFFIDEACHSSAAGPAAALPREAVHRFRSADPDDLARQVRGRLRPGERPLVITDGVFPRSGEIPPLGAYGRLALEHGGMVLVDDAHGMAVVGPSGRGSPAEEGLAAGSFLQAGTLSKGFGVFGGVAAGPRDLLEKIHLRSLAFIGSTGLAPPLAAAALKSLEILESHPEMISGLRQRMLRLKEQARALGFPVPPSPAPILSVAFGDPARSARVRDLFLRRGIYALLIHYPGSPPGGHFRFTFSSAHSEEEIGAFLDTLGEAAGI